MRLDAILDGEKMKVTFTAAHNAVDAADGDDVYPVEELPKYEAALKAGLQLPTVMRSYAVED